VSIGFESNFPNRSTFVWCYVRDLVGHDRVPVYPRSRTTLSSPMDDLATVRAEIKSWERSFKEQHGRPPTVSDIKENKGVGQLLQTLHD